MKLAFVIACLLAVTNAYSDIESLARSKTWYRLLHYDQEKGTSSIISERFFLSPKGHLDPFSELKATLETIESEVDGLPEIERISCRFPARLHFIKKSLGIVPKLNCPVFEAFMESHGPESITFIFASQFLGNPASSMGHSFLRMNRKDKPDLLGLSFSYFAQSTKGDNILTYIYKGLFGGYVGKYDFDRFYPRAIGYGSTENRDLWEYKLKLSEDEKLLLFKHAQELIAAGEESYYFLDRNCSFLLLKFIDVAKPHLHLADEADGFFVTPQEAVKVLHKNHLIEEQVFRPSLRMKANAYYEAQTSRQKSITKKLVEGSISADSVFETAPLNAALSLVALERAVKKSQDNHSSQLLTSLGKQRSSLAAQDDILTKIQTDNQHRDPLWGHDTLQAHIGLAVTDKTSGFQIGFRPAAHALDDLPIGFIPNTQLIFLETILRLENLQERPVLRLRKLTFVDIKSLVPHSPVNNQVSWAAQLAILPTLGSQCEDCRALRSSISGGYSKNLAPSLLSYGLIGPQIEMVKPNGNVKIRAGSHAQLGLLSQMSDSFFFRIENRTDYYFFDFYQDELVNTIELSLSWRFEQNSNLHLLLSEALNLKNRDYNSNDLVMRWSHHY